MGIHAAADTEYDWPWYGEMLGARFKSHPAIQQATLSVAPDLHPATSHLPLSWSRTDEWYDFRAQPDEHRRVLLRLDETTYSGHDMVGDAHPIAWCRELEGGRSLYTGLGHTNESYDDPAFERHLAGAIAWANGLED